MSKYRIFILIYFSGCLGWEIAPAQSINTDSLARAYLQSNDPKRHEILYPLRESPSELLTVVRKIRKQAKQLNIPDTLSSVYAEFGNAFYELGEYDSSIHYINKVVSLVRQPQSSGDSLRLANMLNLIGIVLDRQGRYASALQKYHEALYIWEGLDFQSGISTAYLNIGNIYAFQKEFYKAIDYYEKSLSISLANQDTVPIIYLYSNIALIWRKNLDSLDLAVDYYQRSLEWAKLQNNENVTAIPLYGFTHVLIKQGELDEAFSNAKYILELAQSQQNTNTILYAWQLLAHVHWAQGASREAIIAAKNAYDLAVKTQVPMEISTSAKLLADYYSDLQDFEKAYDYKSTQLSYQDSVYSVEKSKIISDLEQTRADTKIQMLEKDNALKKALIVEREKAIDRQMGYVVVTSLLAILSLGGLALLYKSNKQRKKASLQLVKQKEQIIETNEQLTRMNEKLHQQQQQLQNQNQDLSQLNELKNKLLSIISHDFRSPLSSLQGIIIMLNSNALSPQEIEQVFESLSSKVENTTNMLDNLLKWTRNQMQGIRVAPEHFLLFDLVKEVLNSQLILAEKKGISLHCRIDKDLLVYADQEMVRLIIRNLVSNAIKFTTQGDFITIKAHSEEQEVIISVIDTGIGMSPDDLEKLFQLKDHTTYGTANEKGTGLGLILCQEFVHINGGKIWVDSELEKGTTFHFTLVTQPQKFPAYPQSDKSATVTT